MRGKKRSIKNFAISFSETDGIFIIKKIHNNIIQILGEIIISEFLF